MKPFMYYSIYGTYNSAASYASMLKAYVLLTPQAQPSTKWSLIMRTCLMCSTTLGVPFFLARKVGVAPQSKELPVRYLVRSFLVSLSVHCHFLETS